LPRGRSGLVNGWSPGDAILETSDAGALLRRLGRPGTARRVPGATDEEDPCRGGVLSNHGGSDKGITGALRFVVSRRGDDALRLETGVIAGDPFLGLDGGIELRYPRASRLGVVLRAGGGLLVEDGFIGPFVRAGGGVEWDVGPRVTLRATGQGGHHGGVGGPHLLYVGLDYSW
jgi:hypothetical protein